jgi:N-acetylglucosamine kinase-like BadF-type ATPase
VGYLGLAHAIKTAATQALAQAQLSMELIAGAGLGVAGYDWSSEREPTLHVAREALGTRAPLEAVNDALIGLIAGASEGWGVGIEAGTGCNCYGRDRHGRIGHVTGSGWRMGEAAGAYQVVDAALHCVSREWSRRGPATALTPAFITLTGARDLEDLLEGLCERRYSLNASAAPLVFQVAAAGDSQARVVIEWAGRELAGLAIGVIRQLGIEALDFELVMVGRLFDGGAMLVEPMCAAVHAAAPHARIVRLDAPPVVGGVLLGMEQLGLHIQAARRQLIETTRTLNLTRVDLGETVSLPEAP